MNTYWYWFNTVSVSIVRDAKKSSRPFSTSHIGLFGFSARICNLRRHHIFVKFISALHLYLDWVRCGAMLWSWFNICPVYVLFFFLHFLIRSHSFILLILFLFVPHFGHFISLYHFMSGERCVFVHDRSWMLGCLTVFLVFGAWICI